MTQHTPGPWHVSVGLNAGYIASNGHGFVPIRTPFRQDAFRTDNIDAPLERTAEANARLIAAAPELLEALKELCQAPADLLTEGERWDNAIAAIAKAEA